MRDATIEANTSTTTARDGTDEKPLQVFTVPDDEGRSRLHRAWDLLKRADRVLLALVVCGATLRFWGIGSQSLWYDEWLTAKAARGSLPDLAKYVGGQAGIPPAYFGLMWVWARVIGDGEAALRAFSTLVGVATIPMAYAAARELGQRRIVARWVALLVTFNPMLIWYSQEARPYSALALLGGASLWALARVHNRNRRVDYRLWAFICALAVAFHYFAVFLVAAEVIGLWLLRRPALGQLRADFRSRLRYWFVTFAPALVVLVGLAPFAILQFSRRGNHEWITDFPLSVRLTNAGRGVLAGPSMPDGRLWMVGAAVLVVAVLLLCLRGSRAEQRVAAASGGLAVACIVLGVGANVVGVDMVIGRYMLVAFVPAAVAIAIALGLRRVPNWVGGAVLAPLTIISVVSVVSVARESMLQRGDWRGVAAAHAADDSGQRLMVLNAYGYTGNPLLGYLDNARQMDKAEPTTVAVDQIDILVGKPSDQPCGGFVGLSCDTWKLGGRPPQPLVDSLSARDQDELSLFIYQARTDPDQLPTQRIEFDDFVMERIELEQFAIESYRLDDPIAVAATDVVPQQELRHSLLIVSGSDGSD